MQTKQISVCESFFDQDRNLRGILKVSFTFGNCEAESSMSRMNWVNTRSAQSAEFSSEKICDI